jgi:hypothetical protein
MKSPRGYDGRCPDNMAYYDFGCTPGNKKIKYMSLQRSEFTASGEQRCWFQHKNGGKFTVPMTLKRTDDNVHLTKMSKQVGDAYDEAQARA